MVRDFTGGKDERRFKLALCRHDNKIGEFIRKFTKSEFDHVSIYDTEKDVFYDFQYYEFKIVKPNNKPWSHHKLSKRSFNGSDSNYTLSIYKSLKYSYILCVLAWAVKLPFVGAFIHMLYYFASELGYTPYNCIAFCSLFLDLPDRFGQSTKYPDVFFNDWDE